MLNGLGNLGLQGKGFTVVGFLVADVQTVNTTIYTIGLHAQVPNNS